MEKLFECFVEWWLEQKYPHLQIESQNAEEIFVKKAKNDKLFGVRPDFLIKKDNKVLCVADAKWKLIEKDEDFSQSDFYQLFAYKHIFKEKEKCDKLALRIYYPKSNYLQNIRVFEYFANEGKIKIIPLDIESELIKP